MHTNRHSPFVQKTTTAHIFRVVAILTIAKTRSVAVLCTGSNTPNVHPYMHASADTGCVRVHQFGCWNMCTIEHCAKFVRLRQSMYDVCVCVRVCASVLKNH